MIRILPALRERRWLLAVMAGAVVATASGAVAESPEVRLFDAPPGEGADRLAASYEQNRDELAAAPFGVPLKLEADVRGGSLHGSVMAVLDHPFASVRTALSSPESWCDMVALHFNVKSCRLDAADSGMALRWQLQVETGRKFYVPSSRRDRRAYQLAVKSNTDHYLDASMSASRGPAWVRDLLIAVEAIPLGEKSTFLHLRYGYEVGLLTRVAMRTYLATLGRAKVGFSVVGADGQGEPLYVRGVQGAIERNAVRYYLAIQAYLDVGDLPQEHRFDCRLRRWYALTDRYRRQLFEMDEREYLAVKHRERRDEVVVAGGPTTGRGEGDPLAALTAADHCAVGLGFASGWSTRIALGRVSPP